MSELPGTFNANSEPSARGSSLWRAPYVGIAVVIIMILGIGLAHALMRAIEEALGHDNTYIASVFLGAAAIIALWYGVKSKSENFATWIGFFSGIMIWMTWVELFFMYYGRKNFGMMTRVDGRRAKSRPSPST